MKAPVNALDQAAALSFLGFDSMEDAHYWAIDNNELNRLDALIDLLAQHRKHGEEEALTQFRKQALAIEKDMLFLQQQAKAREHVRAGNHGKAYEALCNAVARLRHLILSLGAEE